MMLPHMNFSMFGARMGSLQYVSRTLGDIRWHTKVTSAVQSPLWLQQGHVNVACMHTLHQPQWEQINFAAIHTLQARKMSMDHTGSHDLMDFPRIQFPNFFKMLRSKFLIHFVILPYLDQNFSIKNFLDGAKEVSVQMLGLKVKCLPSSVDSLVFDNVL